MKVVVSAASRHGSTEMIADCIHEELEYRGCQAYLMDPDSLTSLEDYDAAVLGSAVYRGHWLKPARKLVTRLEGQLRQMPVWLFSSGPVGGFDPEAPPTDAVDIATRLCARDHRVFPGRLDRDLLSFSERLRLRGSGAENGDDRDWIEIGRWAHTIADTLRADGPRADGLRAERPIVGHAAT